jgi:hypothetical protein
MNVSSVQEVVRTVISIMENNVSGSVSLCMHAETAEKE